MADRLHPKYSRPCTHYQRALGRHCGATPTRMFLAGPRCREHAPVAVRPVPTSEPGNSPGDPVNRRN